MPRDESRQRSWVRTSVFRRADLEAGIRAVAEAHDQVMGRVRGGGASAFSNGFKAGLRAVGKVIDAEPEDIGLPDEQPHIPQKPQPPAKPPTKPQNPKR